MRNKKGQIAIFIIIGVIIVIIIALLFFTRTSKPIVDRGVEFSPESFLGSCVRESINEKSELIFSQGGLTEPKDFVFYNGKKINYICKNINFYEPCINQYPLFIETIRKNLENELRTRLSQCLNSLEEELKARKYSVRIEQLRNVNVILKPGKIETRFEVNIDLSKNNVEQRFSDFTFDSFSPMYDIATVVAEITKQEAHSCYFEYVGFNILYPEFDIKIVKLSDQTNIYTVKHVDSGKEMHFAIRSCALPMGI